MDSCLPASVRSTVTVNRGSQGVRLHKVPIHSNIHSNYISSDWEKITYSVPQGTFPSPSLFLICINDLLKVLIQNALTTLFADDTRVIVTVSNIIAFQRNLKVILEQLNNWFNVNHYKKVFHSFSNKERS